MQTTTRSANLRELFQDGESPLLMRLATLSVIYEDFRLEFEELNAIRQLNESEKTFSQYRLLYFLRRSIASMQEFQSCLMQLSGTQEFKTAQRAQAALAKELWDDIDAANKYLQKHCNRIKDWRNDFGGHVQHTAIERGIREARSTSEGSVTWVFDPKDFSLPLELDYACEVVATAMGSKSEWNIREILEILMGAYPSMQSATIALINLFIWPRLKC